MKPLFISLSILCSLVGFAQDAHFSQYNSAPLHLNPGFAGSNGCGRVTTGHRIQWPGLPGSYVTTHVAYDHYLHAIRGGLGLSYYHDNAGYGTLFTDQADLIYASHLPVSIGKSWLVIKPGVSAGYRRRKIDTNKLTFGSMIDPRGGFVYSANQDLHETRHNLDLGAGLVIYSKHFHGGFAAHHLTGPDEGFIGKSKLPMKLTAHLAATFGNPDSSMKLSCSPHVLFMKQQDFQQLLAGVAVKFDKYILGFAYRSEDAYIVQAGFQMPLFRVGYSYDHIISKLTNIKTGGSHELMVSFNILHKKEKEITPLSFQAF
jgi:type IX secretion system PorP/SprF family membrane protein